MLLLTCTGLSYMVVKNSDTADKLVENDEKATAPESLVPHLVDNEVVSLASQVVGQVAIFAELHYHHQWAC